MATRLYKVLTASLKKPTQLRTIRVLGQIRPTPPPWSLPPFRPYATSCSFGDTKACPSCSRKQVTIRNDDGRVQWDDLTVREKAARTTQQTFNFGVVLLGLSMTVGGLLEYWMFTILITKIILDWDCLFPVYRCVRFGQ